MGRVKVFIPEDLIFNRVISVISETTLTISDSIETESPVESEIGRVASLSSMEITEITRLHGSLCDILLCTVNHRDVLNPFLPGHASIIAIPVVQLAFEPQFTIHR